MKNFGPVELKIYIFDDAYPGHVERLYRYITTKAYSRCRCDDLDTLEIILLATEEENDELDLINKSRCISCNCRALIYELIHGNLPITDVRCHIELLNEMGYVSLLELYNRMILKGLI